MTDPEDGVTEIVNVPKLPVFIVILDANVWVTERLLQTTVGTALLLAVTTSDGVIGVPEVVELEVSHVLATHAEQAVEAVRKGARLLRQLSGRKATHQVPTQEAIQNGIEQRWAALSGALQRFPFTHEHAKAALSRIINKISPCGENNEQFRDACIWAAAMEAGKETPVSLITNDSAFYEGRDRTRGALAEVLRHEAHELGVNVLIYTTVSKFLESITPRVEVLNEAEMEGIVLEAIKGVADDVVAKNSRSFCIVHSSLPWIRGYATPKPSAIAISFEGQFGLERVGMSRKNEPKAADLHITGTCSYDPKTRRISEIELEEWGTRMKGSDRSEHWFRQGIFEREFSGSVRLIE
jgi:hypothetical protein